MADLDQAVLDNPAAEQAAAQELRSQQVRAQRPARTGAGQRLKQKATDAAKAKAVEALATEASLALGPEATVVVKILFFIRRHKTLTLIAVLLIVMAVLIIVSALLGVITNPILAAKIGLQALGQLFSGSSSGASITPTQ